MYGRFWSLKRHGIWFLRGFTGDNSRLLVFLQGRVGPFCTLVVCTSRMCPQTRLMLPLLCRTRTLSLSVMTDLLSDMQSDCQTLSQVSQSELVMQSVSKTVMQSVSLPLLSFRQSAGSLASSLIVSTLATFVAVYLVRSLQNGH